jgi:hypothetical protein
VELVLDPDSGPLFSSGDLRIQVIPEPNLDPEPIPVTEPVLDLDPEPDPGPY